MVQPVAGLLDVDRLRAVASPFGFVRGDRLGFAAPYERSDQQQTRDQGLSAER
jgi:hypothetical protein